ncbi:hypothetical protein EG329_005872 [Mollisiaceae sp. DMI_Dod_QoI]|nr:hypothetical protein EG329_005872 [Helotiales sp. DMI_Dod_QoI]
MKISSQQNPAGARQRVVKKSINRPKAASKARTVPSSAASTEFAQQCVAVEFHSFPKLPTELRLKVWRYHMEVPRILEMNLGRHGSWIDGYTWARVTRKGRQPPAILHTCREARKEAKEVYELRALDVSTQESSEIIQRKVYYNPQADIVFFNNPQQLSLIKSLFKPGLLQPIARLALKVDQACLFEVYDKLSILHGSTGPQPYEGCPGLNEVYLVVDSSITPAGFGLGELTPDTGMRPAAADGLTKPQKSTHKRFVKAIQEIEGTYELGTPITGGAFGLEVLFFQWISKNQPTHKFISFTPYRCADEMRCDAVTFENTDSKLFNKFVHANNPVRKSIEEKTGCSIIFRNHNRASKFSESQKFEEIGFKGSESSIAQAKATVMELIRKGNAGKVVKIPNM